MYLKQTSRLTSLVQSIFVSLLEILRNIAIQVGQSQIPKVVVSFLVLSNTRNCVQFHYAFCLLEYFSGFFLVIVESQFKMSTLSISASGFKRAAHLSGEKDSSVSVSTISTGLLMTAVRVGTRRLPGESFER